MWLVTIAIALASCQLALIAAKPEPCLEIPVVDGFEPSGLGWHHGLQRLFAVSSLGELASFSDKGERHALSSW